MPKLGMIVRMDNSGLGNQTRSLFRMLKPDRVMIVDSTSFNGNVQHPEWYMGAEGFITGGWPTTVECSRFMKDLTHVITAETVYNPHVLWLGQRMGIKVFIHPNLFLTTNPSF